MSLKKIIAITMAVLLVISLTACAGDKEDEDASGDGQFGEAAIVLPDYDVKTDKVKILTWADPSNLKNPNLWLYNFNEKLKSEYGCEMDIIYTEESNVGIRATQLVLSGQSPDLIAYNARNNPTFVINNIVQPWDDYIDFNEPIFKDVKDINDKYRINGKVYTMITNWINQGFTYFWTEDLQELGLESPRDLYAKDEWTWSKLEEYAIKLTQKGTDGTVTRYGVGIDYNLMHLVTGESLVKSNGSSYTNNLRSTKLADFFNYMQKLVDVLKVSPKQANLFQQFQSHGISMYVGSRDIFDNRMFDEQKNDEIQFAPSPRWEGADKYYAPGRISAIWLAKGAENIEAACAYVAIWHLLVGEVDEKIDTAVKRLATAVRGHTEEDYALTDEMNHSDKFELIIAEDTGLGVNWSTTERSKFLNEVVNWSQPWATSVEKYSPLLDAGIKEAKDGLEKVK